MNSRPREVGSSLSHYSLIVCLIPIRHRFAESLKVGSRHCGLLPISMRATLSRCGTDRYSLIEQPFCRAVFVSVNVSVLWTSMTGFYHPAQLCESLFWPRGRWCSFDSSRQQDDLIVLLGNGWRDAFVRLDIKVGHPDTVTEIQPISAELTRRLNDSKLLSMVRYRHNNFRLWACYPKTSFDINDASSNGQFYNS